MATCSLLISADLREVALFIIVQKHKFCLLMWKMVNGTLKQVRALRTIRMCAKGKI